MVWTIGCTLYFSEAEELFNNVILEIESKSNGTVSDSMYYNESLVFVYKFKGLKHTYLYLFKNLLLCNQYEIILEELEKFKFFFTSARFDSEEDPHLSGVMHVQNLNYYYALKAYCNDKLGNIEEANRNRKRIFFLFEHSYFNHVYFSEVLARLFIENDFDYIEPRVFIDTFLNLENYSGTGSELLYRSYFLRKIYPDEHIAIFEKELNTFLDKETCKTSSNYDNNVLIYINNFERVFMRLAFLHYEKGNNIEAMKWFKRSLTEYSTFDGDWDYWLRYRYYEEGEKEALLKLKGLYLAELSK